MAGLKCNSYIFPVLQQTKVIIWDEVPIQHKYDIDTVDQCLKDLCEGDRSGVLQEIPQLNYSMEYVTTHLQEIP